MHDTSNADPKTAAAPGRSSAAPLAEATLRVHGLGCRHCVGRITRALEHVEGASQASMDYDAGLATVTYDPGRTDPRSFVEAIVLEGADRGQVFDADLLEVRELRDNELYPS